MKVKILIVLIIFVLFAYITLDVLNITELIHAKRLLNEIKQYNSKHGRYPDNLSNIRENISEEGPVYYKKIDEQRYIIWFGTSLGESKVFDSKYGEWFDYLPE